MIDLSHPVKRVTCFGQRSHKAHCPEDILPVASDLHGPCLALPFNFCIKSCRHNFLLILPPLASSVPPPCPAPRSALHMRLPTARQATVASSLLHDGGEARCHNVVGNHSKANAISVAQGGKPRNNTCPGQNLPARGCWRSM